jgi:hypothetical protein
VHGAAAIAALLRRVANNLLKNYFTFSAVACCGINIGFYTRSMVEAMTTD